MKKFLIMTVTLFSLAASSASADPTTQIQKSPPSPEAVLKMHVKQLRHAVKNLNEKIGIFLADIKTNEQKFADFDKSNVPPFDKNNLPPFAQLMEAYDDYIKAEANRDKAAKAIYENANNASNKTTALDDANSAWVQKGNAFINQIGSFQPLIPKYGDALNGIGVATQIFTDMTNAFADVKDALGFVLPN